MGPSPGVRVTCSRWIRVNRNLREAGGLGVIARRLGLTRSIRGSLPSSLASLEVPTRIIRVTRPARITSSCSFRIGRNRWEPPSLSQLRISGPLGDSGAVGRSESRLGARPGGASMANSRYRLDWSRSFKFKFRVPQRVMRATRKPRFAPRSIRGDWSSFQIAIIRHRLDLMCGLRGSESVTASESLRLWQSLPGRAVAGPLHAASESLAIAMPVRVTGGQAFESLRASGSLGPEGPARRPGQREARDPRHSELPSQLQSPSQPSSGASAPPKAPSPSHCQ